MHLGLETLIERFGENGTLVLAGLVIGLAFGFLAQRSRFCLRSAVIEFARNPRPRAWRLPRRVHRRAAVSRTQARRFRGRRQHADRWLDAEDTTLRVGSFSFRIQHVGPAHTPEDLVVYVPERGALFAGDLVFRGRIPFVGQADSRQWIASLARLIEFRPLIMIPGHGPVSREPLADLEMTRDYLVYLRTTMGAAAAELEPFDEVYAKTDWSRFERMPLFRAANRVNAYNTYLLMEQQGRR